MITRMINEVEGALTVPPQLRYLSRDAVDSLHYLLIQRGGIDVLRAHFKKQQDLAARGRELEHALGSSHPFAER